MGVGIGLQDFALIIVVGALATMLISPLVQGIVGFFTTSVALAKNIKANKAQILLRLVIVALIIHLAIQMRDINDEDLMTLWMLAAMTLPVWIFCLIFFCSIYSPVKKYLQPAPAMVGKKEENMPRITKILLTLTFMGMTYLSYWLIHMGNGKTAP